MAMKENIFTETKLNTRLVVKNFNVNIEKKRIFFQ